MPPSSKSLKKSIKLMRSAGDLICRCTVAAVASMTIQPGTGLLQDDLQAASVTACATVPRDVDCICLKPCRSA